MDFRLRDRLLRLLVLLLLRIIFLPLLIRLRAIEDRMFVRML
jgi:hypothetical protein